MVVAKKDFRVISRSSANVYIEFEYVLILILNHVNVIPMNIVHCSLDLNSTKISRFCPNLGLNISNWTKPFKVVSIFTCFHLLLFIRVQPTQKTSLQFTDGCFRLFDK